uniref:Uncharacterized protein LOC111113612 n=1 Tax=Crassostrea virginica TaxID=6565 RepID=A0A8B8BW69_CRAVI|nr:uncharacterized protein LOC111113612 [Crassostrea virginica]
MFNMLNEIVNYTNWVKSEPGGGTSNRETCAVLTDQGWRLVHCSIPTQALCSRRLRDCKCPCERIKNRVEITDSLALQAKIKSIQRKLRIKKRTLSGSLRTKISAIDTRISSVLLASLPV